MSAQSVMAQWADGGVFDEIAIERRKQDEKWGEQNHPPHGGDPKHHDRTLHHFTTSAIVQKALCNSRATMGTIGWDDILLEEVYEAVAESDPAKIRGELIQVAAVAVAWIEALDRATE